MKREFKKEFKDEELLSQNYTLLSRIPDSPLYEQVHSQIGRYMVELLKNDISFTDSPEARAKLLTNPNLAFKHKMDYIQKLATTHRELSPIILNSLFEEYYKVPEKYNSDLHKYQKQFENICNSDKYRQQLLELGLKLEPKS